MDCVRDSEFEIRDLKFEIRNFKFLGSVLHFMEYRKERHEVTDVIVDVASMLAFLNHGDEFLHNLYK